MTSTDLFSAHLDRGWDLVQRGDTQGAEASARQALEVDPSSPEAYNLLGFVAAIEGDAEDAIEAYRQAIALDDAYLEAMLNAAEVYIHPLGDFDEAIALCDQAIDLSEASEEKADALLLKFDACMGKGDRELAAKAIAALPDGPYSTPTHTFLVGRACYELGQVDRAARLVEESVSLDPRHGEAQYYLGLIRDERGDSRGATQAFIRSRELDLEAGMPPWMPTRDEFAELAKSAVLALPAVLRRPVQAAEVYVTDMPGLEYVAEGIDPRALVLVDSPSQQATFDPLEPAPSPRIFIYALNVARMAGHRDGLAAEVTSALEREISNVFLEGKQSERPQRELN